MATLLGITNVVCDEIGIPRPTTIISNSDDDARQLLQFANRTGRELTKAADWTILTELHTFSTASGTAEYALPSDYGRLLRETEWNRTSARPMRGQVNAQEWQTIKSGLTGGGIVNQRMRIARGGQIGSATRSRMIYIDPTPTATETIAFEYISSHWVRDTGDTSTATAFAADTDVILLDEDLFVLQMIVRWRRSKGLDFSSEADEFNSILDREAGLDRPSPVLNMAYQPNIRLLDNDNVPETGYGGV